MEIYEIGLRRDIGYIVNLIRFLNSKEDVHGIMVQLPLPKRLAGFTSEVVKAIDPKKDVDGLRPDSLYLHPTSKAVVEIIGNERIDTIIADENFAADDDHIKNLVKYTNRNFGENERKSGKFLKAVMTIE